MNKASQKITWAVLTCGLAGAFQVGCGRTSEADDSSVSEVATSSVSGAVNNSAGSSLAFNGSSVPSKSKLDRVLDVLNPVGTAWATTWTCSGGSLSPTFAGNGAYTYTPVSCQVTWPNGKTTSAQWSGDFYLNYEGSCDSYHRWIGNQAEGCALTRTAGTSGNTRTLTGPYGTTYAVTHDTNGQGTGWDSSVSPAPNNSGVVVTCGLGGCSSNGTLVINGSHLTATRTFSGGSPKLIWDHTVSTGTSPITVAASSAGRTVNGVVNVQHNLAKYTATSTFHDVIYGQTGCCFPTSGTVTTSFRSGPDTGKTESLSFSNTCGQATLTNASGTSESITLQHCI